MAAELGRLGLDPRGAWVSPQVVFFPIRHHSPACAWYLQHLIRDCRPRAVLVEGPASFTALIPLILDPATRAPVAIYTSFVEEPGERPNPGSRADERTPFGPPRRAAYYPFCDYSPEWVALRTGAEVGAALRFIDLDFPEMIAAENPEGRSVPQRPVGTLQAERHLARSRFLQALARRTGCRDHNDLWDHLFESRLSAASAHPPTFADCEGFIRDVAAWCQAARADATAAELEADGTLAREEAMAAAIRAEIAAGQRGPTSPRGPVMVVTGGFHTVALPRQLAEPARHRRTRALKPRELLTCLVRYSYDQLDALNGYAAGMPSPFYYAQLWQRIQAPAPPTPQVGEPLTEVCARVLVELGQLTRRKQLVEAVSVAEQITALDHARRLAVLRGRPGPMREDLLDGIRSCYVKGAMDAEGEAVLALAQEALSGTAMGEVPAAAGEPPIVADLRRTAASLRLKLSDSARRKTSLDLYRNALHRQVSRLFHRLNFLGVPWATLIGGPDFVQGAQLDRLIEQWEYQWVPQTDSRLVEASLWGATIEQAAVTRLAHAVGELEFEGRSRSAATAATLLTHACRMGLHSHLEGLRAVLAAQISDDASLASVAAALQQLVLLWESREPLEAHRLPEIPDLIRVAYARGCYLVQDLAGTPPEAAFDTLKALQVIRELIGSDAGEASRESRDTASPNLDAALFYEPLQAVLAQARLPALLTGAAAGLLWSVGRLEDPALLRLLTGFLGAATTSAGDPVAFLTGLLRTCREIAWRQPAVVDAVDALLARWSEDEFVARLPHLRLAFADLTPRETDRLAAVVARRHQSAVTDLIPAAKVSEDQILAGVRLNAAVRQALERDGLAAPNRSDS